MWLGRKWGGVTCLIAPHQRAVLVRNPVAQSDFALGLRAATEGRLPGAKVSRLSPCWGASLEED